MSDISETIIRLRKRKGWTQQELADFLFVSRSLVAMWEQGTRKPDYLSVERMADLFEITVGELIPDEHYVYFSQDELSTFENEIKSLFESESGEKDTNEHMAAVFNCFVSQLSKMNRAVFISRYLLMKTCRSIGDDIGRSETSVRNRLFCLRKEFNTFVRKRRRENE